MTTSENCQVTVSFGDADGKSVSMVMNQQTSETSQSVAGGKSSDRSPQRPPGGAGPGGGPGAGPGGQFGKKEQLTCYDCDGEELDCKLLQRVKGAEVGTITAARLCISGVEMIVLLHVALICHRSVTTASTATSI